MTGSQQPFPLKPNVGAQLSPHQIVGRDGTILQARQLLLDGHNLVINDPRRLGKSCMLERLANEPGDGMVVLLRSYQDVRTSTHLIHQLLRQLKQHQGFKKRFAGALSSLFDKASLRVGYDDVTISLAANQQHRRPVDVLHEMLEAVDNALEGEGELLVLAIDEITECINNIANGEGGADEVATVLQTMQQGRKEFRNIRWILTGSIGFHHVIRYGTDTTEAVIGDLKNLPLGPLSREDAGFLTHCLALGIDRTFSGAAVDAMFTCSDGIPFLIQALASGIRDSTTSQTTVTAKLVEAAFATYISDRDESRAFEHFVSRLDTYYPDPLRSRAIKLLDHTSQQPSTPLTKVYELLAAGTPSCDKQDAVELLKALMDDHYLVRDGSDIRWRYPILARIWREKQMLP